MALVVETTAFTNWSASAVNTIDITKPTGLAVGDLMVAHVTAMDSSDPVVALPAGWTNVTTRVQDGGRVYTRTMFRIATAGDVAASVFPFTSNITAFMSGGMYRISGAPTASVVQSFSNPAQQSLTASALMNTTILIEPLVPNSLFITFYTLFFLTGASFTLGSYTSTPSVTRTEAWDNYRNYGGGNFNPLSAAVHGVYSGSSNITDISATLSADQSPLYFSTSILINPQQNATVSIPHLAIEPTLFGVVPSVNVSLDVAHTAITPAIQGVAFRLNNPVWTDQIKPPATWVTETK